MVAKKTAEFGKNILNEKETTPWYIKLLHELTSVFSLLIWTAGLLCLIVYGLSPTDVSNVILLTHILLF